MALIKTTISSFLLVLFFTLFLGILYPIAVAVIAQALFPWEANGSFIESNDNRLGSVLIGQSFTDPNYFWGRPSATTPYPYNALNSMGSNLAASNPKFIQQLKERVQRLKKADPDNKLPIPIELITASGSGLDPEISPAAAFYQVHRIAKLRKIPEEKLNDLVKRSIKPRDLLILGEPRINILKLNRDLDGMK